MGNKQLTIGMFGFGNVGRGLYDVLNTISSKEAKIKRICVRDITKERGVEADFTDNADDLFNDKDINLIVEVIDDAEAAYRIVKRALTSGLSVVSGNKKMLAHMPGTGPHPKINSGSRNMFNTRPPSIIKPAARGVPAATSKPFPAIPSAAVTLPRYHIFIYLPISSITLLSAPSRS